MFIVCWVFCKFAVGLSSWPLGEEQTDWHTSFACQHYGICCQLVLLWGQSLLKFSSDSPLPHMQFNAVCWSRKVVLDKECFVQCFASLGRAGGARESSACSSEWVEQHSSNGVVLSSKRWVRSKAGRDTVLVRELSRELRWVLSSQQAHHSLIRNVLCFVFCFELNLAPSYHIVLLRLLSSAAEYHFLESRARMQCSWEADCHVYVGW